jgi:AcrR family transcriptional regulator
VPSKNDSRSSARDRLLAAADELFYQEGVHSVGIDRVIQRAGVAKASLYNCFGSKDELIRAYLTARHAARQQRISGKLALCATPRERLLAVFDVLGDVFSEPGFRGCAFLNASAESRPGSTTRQTCDDCRAWVRSLFTELARAAGAADPEALAQQLVMLYDGATVAAQMDRDSTAAEAARAMAATLIDAAAQPRHSPAERKASG